MIATSRAIAGSAVSASLVAIATGGGKVAVLHTWLQLAAQVQPQSHPAPGPGAESGAPGPAACAPWVPACMSEGETVTGAASPCPQAPNAAALPDRVSTQTSAMETRRRNVEVIECSLAQPGDFRQSCPG